MEICLLFSLLVFYLLPSLVLGNCTVLTVYFHADDTVIYCCACTVHMVFEQLQLADCVHSHLCQLRLLLNALLK